MGSRLSLHLALESVTNVKKVYFQPPESLKLEYPCIVYYRSPGNTIHADDKTYRHVKSYDITIIDKNADSEIADYILNNFDKSAITKIFCVDNLYHYNMSLYY